MKAQWMVFWGIVLGLLLSSNPAPAITAGNLQDLKVVGYHFTTRIASPTRMRFANDPAKGRYIVLKLAATVQKDDAVIFAPDFVLAYSHQDGREDRADCSAIGTAETSAPGEYDQFGVGSVPSITMNHGKGYWGLGFFIEPDVETIEIHRIGAEPLIYRIGTDRSYSVFITTNIDAKVLSEAKDVIERGGYYITRASENLVKDQRGITIHYAEQAESQAREISQRLMAKFGVVPTLKKMELVSEVDIVVWLGK